MFSRVAKSIVCVSNQPLKYPLQMRERRNQGTKTQSSPEGVSPHKGRFFSLGYWQDLNDLEGKYAREENRT